MTTDSGDVPPSAPPNKRRRRWLIVALLLLVVSGVAWWNWPRGDARFVGKWVLSDRGTLRTTVVLNANGGGYSRRTGWSSFVWDVSDDAITIGTDLPKWIPYNSGGWSQWLSSNVGWCFVAPAQRYRFEIVSSDSIRLIRTHSVSVTRNNRPLQSIVTHDTFDLTRVRE